MVACDMLLLGLRLLRNRWKTRLDLSSLLYETSRTCLRNELYIYVPRALYELTKPLPLRLVKPSLHPLTRTVSNVARSRPFFSLATTTAVTASREQKRAVKIFIITSGELSGF